MAQRRPVVVTAAGLAELPPADTLPVPAYGSGGPITSCRQWAGEAVTITGGSWSIDISSAGFTATPRVLATALSASTALTNSASAIVTGRSPTLISGYVNLPATVVLGGVADQRAGAGVTVMVLAIGP